MDNSPTLQKSVGKLIETKAKKQRNKLVRSTESFGHTARLDDNAVDGEPLRPTPTRASGTTNSPAAEAAAPPATLGDAAANVMGVGFATPPTATQHQQQQQQRNPTTAAAAAPSEPAAAKVNQKAPAKSQMQDRISDKDETSKEKTEQLKLTKKDTATKTTEKPPKQQKDSKFAEKLRRSFRRGEHKSLEIKRPEKVESLHGSATHSPQEGKHFAQKGLQIKKTSQSIFSLSNLPGLGGHINPALLLDSPDEGTPPEFAYQHLSSVATTNSSTSLESNFEFGDQTSSQSNISYWAWHQSNPSMGGEVSTTGHSAINALATFGRDTKDAKENKENRENKENKDGDKKSTGAVRKLEVHAANNRSEGQQFVHVAAGPSSYFAHTPASRSCSITSETSSSTKLTRLQNFLFKSSNESSKSFQGHSNEAFTASSHNSSSGEWENLGAFATSSSSGVPTHDFHVGSFPEETAPDETVACSADEAGNYYQYTLTSPNNPFLPEIIARTYHSTYDDEPHEMELDSNVTSVKYTTMSVGTHSAQLPTPSYSRAGSQESTHSEGAVCLHSVSPQAPTPSPASSSSSTPGRQKRKLFSLNSPTRHLQHQRLHLHAQPAPQQPPAPPATEAAKPNSGYIVRSLNPFLPHAPCCAAGLCKRQPLKQCVTSPGSAPVDLSTKRDDFLRATMQICLVVSPPNSKLQIKSKSLTHLDGLDATSAGHQATATGRTNIRTVATMPKIVTAPAILPALGLAAHSNSNSNSNSHAPPQLRQYNCPPPLQPTSTIPAPYLARPPPTIYTQTPHQVSTARTSPYALSPTGPPISTPIPHPCCNSRHPCFGGAYARVTPPHYYIQHQYPYPYPYQPQPPFQSTSPNESMVVVPTLTPPQQHTLGPALAGGLNSANLAAASGAGSVFHYGPGATGAISRNTMKSSLMQRKKPLLTRSEVSSSEYFSVSFYTEQGGQDEEFIAAIKGVTLSQALSNALRRRNLSFSQIAIVDSNPPTGYLDTGSSPLASSLDENTDVENLAGHHLIVTERDGSRKTLQKGSRTRPPRLLSSASTEETGDANVAGKQLKQRWSGLFGIKNPQQSQLCELLNGYAKNGVPQKSTPLNFDHPDFDAAQLYLDNMHKSWRDIVASEGMSENETRIQTAIWELVTTEVYYIHALQTVTDLFLACLEAVQEERLLTDVDQHRLFSNVRDICEANIRFWTLYIYPMVAHSVITREPLRIAFFQQGFVAFASIFSPYKKYCAEQSTCQFYCKELNRTNSLFTSYLAWCESQKMCNRLRLADILVRPMQRLTKYSLLLTAIKKHMSNLDEIDAIDGMIHTVENFVCSVNNHLTTRQENERLKGVMARIESYDVVDTNNEQLEKLIKQYSQMFDLCAPMKGCQAHHVRHLFMEGDHKFKDSLGKADVHCFLLTDMLLICKTMAKKGLGALKVIRQPYLTDRLVVTHANNILSCVYLNEFHVVVAAFTLQCSEAKNWYEALKRARMFYQRLKQGGNNWDSFRFMGSGASGGTADSLGVKKSPMNSSICSHVTSANNSHSGSVEWNDSRNYSVDFEKTNSLSSDEGSSLMGKGKNLLTTTHKQKVTTTSANTLSVQPLNHLGQSLPNLNLHHSHTNLYRSYSNNTLLVPGTTTSHSGNLLLSPSHRGISYPPPSPTRVPFRRSMAFSIATKNPPLVKTRNITSQNSINWVQIPATPTPPSPMSQYNAAGNVNLVAASISTPLLAPEHRGIMRHPSSPMAHVNVNEQNPAATAHPLQLSTNHSQINATHTTQQAPNASNETDV